VGLLSGRGARVALAAAVGVVAAAAGLVAFVRHRGLTADRSPGALETVLARRLVRLSIPASAASAHSPLAADPDAWRAAVDPFKGNCAACHGGDGRGATVVGPNLYPPVPDLTAPAVQQLSDGELFAVIRHGVRWTGMPAFRSVLGEADTWRLVAYVRHLPQAAAAEPGPAPASIVMDGTRFQPSDLTVALGDSVSWRNADPFPHNVTASAAGFRSGDLEPDGRWQFRPSERGVFEYACTLHPGMKGVLRVR